MRVQTETVQFSLGVGETTNVLEAAPYDSATLAHVYAEVCGVFPLAPPSIGLRVFVSRILSGSHILIERTPLMMLRCALIAGDVEMTPATPITFRIANESGHPVLGSVGFAFILRPIIPGSNFDRRPR